MDNATTAEESESLLERYENARNEARANSADAICTAFEHAVNGSQACINVDFDWLHTFITTDQLYLSYRQQVRTGLRARAEGLRDNERATVDSLLFGTHDEEIRFAALTLDGRGLSSYGAYTMTLRSVTIEERATVLEENSFGFVERHSLGKGTPIPTGFRAAWPDRARLAVAKQRSRFIPSLSTDDFPTMVLSSEGKRATDAFMEVHIYGGFDHHAVERIHGPFRSSDRKTHARLAYLRDRIVNGIVLVEE